ncbi:MAG: GNAT family N-acetyltransferase [Acutalibacteraceae bacterium]|nr:GNAT family N-acetyltransferase [Acutalibacteraceae bacterium]
MSVQIKEMTIDHYDEIFAMWQITSKRALSKADRREEIERYLKRNSGLSQIAVADGKIVGTVLAGHDGRRGFIHHMAVLPEYRRKGIAKAMATKAIEKLAEEGIVKTHIFTYRDNSAGQSFWGSLGFKNREDIYVYSYEKSND